MKKTIITLSLVLVSLHVLSSSTDIVPLQEDGQFVGIGRLYAQQEQPQRSSEDVARKQTEMLSRELNLSSEQRQIIYEIHLRYAKMRQLSDSKEDIDARISNMLAEIEDILNADQLSRFKAKQEEIREKRSSRVINTVNR